MTDLNSQSSKSNVPDPVAVKAAFARCYAIEDPTEQSQLLDQLENEDPTLAAEVRALLQALHSSKKIRAISEFVPLLDLSLQSVPEPLEEISHELRMADVANVSMLQSIEKTTTGETHVVLKSTSDDEPVVRMDTSEADEEINQRDGRYRLDGEIARGGMGAILKGRDTDLGRDLAVKVLLKQHRSDPNIVKRFIEEAQIGGQLQHPGIAPVYELGQFKDHRPFFTMKLIKGKTLAAMLSERKSVHEDRSKFLGIFEHICQTMAYAHSRGVLHRDLKPSNVMVGAFGEVQVMDWGLAKVLATGGVADERRQRTASQDKSIIETIRTIDSDTVSQEDTDSVAGSATQLGSVMGTPAYMSPEQAAGETDCLDERTDVFSLGAILCEILTGSPIYRHEKRIDQVMAARNGDTNDAISRLDATTTDVELKSLVKDCLAIDRPQRPIDAQAVTKRMSDYLESVDRRLRETELEVERTKTQAEEERKRRKVVVALAGCVVLAGILSVGGWMWLKEKDAQLAQMKIDAQISEATQRSELEQKVRAELSVAETLANHSKQIPSQRDLERARNSLHRAEQALSEKSIDPKLEARLNELITQITRLQSDLRFIQRLEEIWILEQQYFAEKDLLAVQPNILNETLLTANPLHDNSLESTSQVGQANVSLTMSNPTALYREAFHEWGIELEETSTREFSRRVRALPTSHQLAVITSLNRWRLLLEADYSLADWSAQQWVPLSPVEMSANGTDIYHPQEDHSILVNGGALGRESDHTVLVSGGELGRGGTIVFETDQTEISGLRLEALLHQSFPNNGPGSGSMGMFAVNGLKVKIAPKSRSGQETPVKIIRGVADNYDSYWPFQVDYWRVSRGGGRPHVAYYRFGKAYQHPDGFRITIQTEDEANSRSRMSSGSLGHFRWSSTVLPDHRVEASLIDLILKQLDSDPWRERAREALLASDTVRLTELVSEKAASSQPSTILAALTKHLISLSNNELKSHLLSNPQWDTVLTSAVTSKHGTEYEVQSDGTIKAVGGATDFEVTTVLVPSDLISDEQPVLCIDFLKTNPSDPDSWIGRRQWLHLREIAVTQSQESSDQHVVKHAFTNAPFPFPVAKLFDGDVGTTVRVPNPDQPRTLYIVLDQERLNRQKPIKVEIHSGGKGYNPGRMLFRTGSVDKSRLNPHEAAGQLLTQLIVERPADPIVNYQLTRYYQRSVPPRNGDAIRHAVVTGTLLDQGLAPSLLFIDVLGPSDLINNPPLRDLALAHARHVESKYPGGPHTSKLRFSLQNDVVENYRQGRVSEAEQLIEFVLDFWHDPVEFLSLVVEDVAFAMKPVAQVRESLVQALDQFIQRNNHMTLSAIDYLQLGNALHNLKEREFAIQLFRQAIQADPDYATPRRLLVEELNILGRRGEAQREFEKALEIYNRKLKETPESLSVWRGRAWLHHVVGRREEAIYDFTEVLKRAPNNTEAIAVRAQNYRSLGKIDLALAGFSRAIELDPYRNWRYLERARVYRDIGEFDAAIADIQKGFEIDPVTDAWWAPQEAMRAFEARIQLLELNNYEAAIEKYGELLQSNPDSFMALRGRAHAYWQLKRYEEAISNINHALSLKPDDPVCHSLRAHVYVEMEEWDAALSDRNRVIELAPDCSAHYFLRAILYRYRGEFRLALSDIQQGLGLDPSQDKKYFPRAAAHALAGDIYLDQLDDAAEAVEHYRSALNLAPDNLSYQEKYQRAEKIVTSQAAQSEQ